MKTKLILNKYLTLLASIVLVLMTVAQLVRACAGIDLYWRENPQVFLQPDIEPSQENFEPFYYTTDFLNSGKERKVDSLPTVDELASEDENTNQWFIKLHNHISRKEIYTFLNESPAYFYDEAPTLKHFTAYYSNNTFVQKIKSNKTALNYFMLAKANEFSYDELDNGWNDFFTWDAYGNTKLPKSVQQPEVCKLIEQKLHTERDWFYKQRYAFQLIRNYRYTYQSDKVDTLYLNYFDTTQLTDLKIAALNYATDALVNAHQQTKANYYAALLFDVGVQKQIRAYNNLSNKINIDSVLPFCRSNKERAMVYALYACKDYYVNTAYIKKAVEFDANNKTINDLLVREINKIDYKLMPDLQGILYENWSEEAPETPEITDENGHIIRIYPSIETNTPILLQLLLDLKLKHTTNEIFYTLCLAHLYLVTQNYSEANQLLSSISAQKLTPKLALQHQLTSALLHIKNTNLSEPTNQEKLCNLLNNIDKRAADFYYNEFIPNGIRIIACGKLVKDGDAARAYLLAESIETIYDSYQLLEHQVKASDINNIITIKNQPKTAFDHFITKHEQLSVNELYRIQGSKYLSKNELSLANESFKKSDGTFIPINFAKLNTNPDGHPCYPYMYKPIPKEEEYYYTPQQVEFHNLRAKQLEWNFNFYSITQTMLNLKQLIKEKKGNIAEHYFNLACLYMEISYYGRAYGAMKHNNYWSWYELEYHEIKSDFAAHYYGSAWAIPYYQLALKHSKNRELTAKCLYALFRCKRHLKRYQNNENSTKDLAYLYQLNDKYANTDYYKIKECWGLSAYVKELRNN